MAKSADLAAEEAEKLAQTMNVEVDTAPAANASTKIIDKDGITTLRAERTEDVLLHSKSGESREESYARFYDYIKKGMDNWTHKDWCQWAGKENNKFWKRNRNRRRHQHQYDRR